jgi:uncharacterized membrane protein YhaH (DUF805 family)
MDFDVKKAIRYFQTVVTEHYTDFDGRVSRRDFWTYIAVYLALVVVVSIVASVIGLDLAPLVNLALFLPTAGIIARRLQDTGRNGQQVWLLMVPVLISALLSLIAALTFGGFGVLLIFLPVLWLLSLIAVLAAIYLIVLCIQPGTPGPNAYGPQPAAAV